MKGFGILFLFAAFVTVSYGQGGGYNRELPVNHVWVDSVYNSMTPEMRIAQLIWPMVEQLGDPNRQKVLLEMINRYQPGGILVMKNKAEPIVSFINKAQRRSNVPMLTAIDAEWGLAMRVEGVVPYPRAMVLGAITNDTLLYRTGMGMARQLREMGISVSFGPVADVNNNPANPVIGVRSFGENANRVARSSVWLMHGLQDGGVMAVAKHFPGHGDTHTDSHLALPIIDHSRQRFDSLELVPFAALIKNGVYGVMTAHLEVPGLEPLAGLPSSLSRKIVTDLLKIQMGFSGLVVTDAMNMKGVKKAGQPGRVDALALAAGNDVVESSENIALAINEIKKSITGGEMSWSDIELKCRKVLAMKYLLGLTDWLVTDSVDVLQRLNGAMDEKLLQQLADASLTTLSWGTDTNLVKAQDSLVILVMPHQKEWRQMVTGCLNAKIVELSPSMTAAQTIKLRNDLKRFGRIIWWMDNSAPSRGIWNLPVMADLRNDKNINARLVVFYGGMPYGLSKISGLKDVVNLVLCYEDTVYARTAVVRFLDGRIFSKGKLPVSIPLFKEGTGMEVGYGLY
ncbi:MAG: glycoside hydrolase family 3 N-terminal domain-containing protein [Breznakibacter sp.]